jgi:hypothetical protein
MLIKKLPILKSFPVTLPSGVPAPNQGPIIQTPLREIDARIVGQRMQPILRGADKDGAGSGGKSGDELATRRIRGEIRESANEKDANERTRDDLSKRQLSNAEKFDKSVLTYSGAGPALSSGF